MATAIARNESQRVHVYWQKMRERETFMSPLDLQQGTTSR